LIFRKISKFHATRCPILKLKCAKFDFRWGFAPDTTGIANSTSPVPSAVFKGPTSKGRAGAEREGKGKGRGMGSKGRRMEGRGGATPKYFGLEPLLAGIHMSTTMDITITRTNRIVQRYEIPSTNRT